LIYEKKKKTRDPLEKRDYNQLAKSQRSAFVTEKGGTSESHGRRPKMRVKEKKKFSGEKGRKRWSSSPYHTKTAHDLTFQKNG